MVGFTVGGMEGATLGAAEVVGAADVAGGRVVRTVGTELSVGAVTGGLVRHRLFQLLTRDDCLFGRQHISVCLDCL